MLWRNLIILKAILMANVNTKKGVIGILTGGGDVPGLNPAIRAVTIRAIREGYEVIGLRRGWASLVDMVREEDYDNSDNFQSLTEEAGQSLRAAPAGPSFTPRAPIPGESARRTFRPTCKALMRPQ